MPTPAIEFAKQSENYENRPRLSVNYREQKPIVEQEKRKLAPSTPNQRNGKSSTTDPLKAKEPIDIKSKKGNQKNQIYKQNVTQ